MNIGKSIHEGHMNSKFIDASEIEGLRRLLSYLCLSLNPVFRVSRGLDVRILIR